MCLGENSSKVQELYVFVQPVNDAPSFILLNPNIEVLEAHDGESATHAFEQFVQNISAGPLEDHQVLTFFIVPLRARVPYLPSLPWINNPKNLHGEHATPGGGQSEQLFDNSSRVSINSNGTLTFVLEPFRYGVVVFSVVLKDDGQTLIGGQDQSQPATFQMTVVSVNGLLSPVQHYSAFAVPS